MTKGERQKEFQAWQVAMRGEIRRAETCDKLAKILLAIPDADLRDVAELMCGWLDHIGAGMPDASLWGDLRSDAEFWADTATTAEIEAYVGAGFRRIERAGFAEGARKRIFVMLWEKMAEADRRAFVQRVDPEGRFQRRVA